MKKLFLILLVFLVTAASAANGPEDNIKYFKLDKIVEVTGKVKELDFKKIYSKSNFVVLKIDDKNKNMIYTVEVSPKWFYSLDIVEGSFVKIIGSLNVLHGKSVILAQSILYSGEIFYFRDKYGFPLWRGMGKRFRKSFHGGKRRKGKI